MTDLVAGQVSLMFPAISAGLPHVRAGKLRALAVTSRKRTPAAPEVYSWIGILGPAALPRHVVYHLHAYRGSPRDKCAGPQQAISDLGIDLIGSSPEQFAKVMEEDLVKFGKLVKASGAKVD